MTESTTSTQSTETRDWPPINSEQKQRHQPPNRIDCGVRRTHKKFGAKGTAPTESAAMSAVVLKQIGLKINGANTIDCDVRLSRNELDPTTATATLSTATSDCRTINSKQKERRQLNPLLRPTDAKDLDPTPVTPTEFSAVYTINSEQKQQLQLNPQRCSAVTK